MGTVDPGAQEERDYFINRLLPQYGISGVVDASYNFDVTQGPQEAQTIIAKMNTSHVTTITMVADPLFPEFFTREASKEQYYPEWFISGTARLVRAVDEPSSDDPDTTGCWLAMLQRNCRN